MGCTPSKQVSAAKDAHEEQVEVGADGINEISIKNDTDVISENGTKSDHNGKTESQKNKFQQKVSQNAVNEKKTENSRYRMPQVSKGEKKFTQSQLDFFEMLDRKIESGPDYVSEDERSKVWTS